MKPKSDLSRQLYELMLQRGYEKNFCDIVTKNLNTDFTASRMIGYLYHYDHPPVEEIADEMISILSDRNRIMQKKELEETNARWNDFLLHGFNDEEEEPKREMKRLKAATHPVNFCICLRSFGISNCDRARILAGFASIPLPDTMKPSSFPAGTPKTHFSGFSLMSYALRLSNVSLKSSTRVSTCLDLMTTSSTYASTVLPIWLARHV